MIEKNRINVHLYVTPICNLKCKHCYYVAWAPDKVPKNLLKISEISQIIVDLSENYDVAFDVEGGEFFLRKDIEELFEILPARYWNNITLTTNGTLPIEVNQSKLKELDEFRFSVEGHTNELQLDMRGVELDSILKIAITQLNNGMHPVLRITLHKKNYDQLPDMIRYFTRLGFRRYSLYEYQPTGRGILYQDEYRLNDSEIQEILRLMRTDTILDGVDILKLSLGAIRIPKVRQEEGMLSRFGYQVFNISGVASLTINYNGSIGVCPWHIGSNAIGKFQSEKFLYDVNNFFEKGRLQHTCNSCSAIRIVYKNAN